MLVSGSRYRAGDRGQRPDLAERQGPKPSRANPGEPALAQEVLVFRNLLQTYDRLDKCEFQPFDRSSFGRPYRANYCKPDAVAIGTGKRMKSDYECATTHVARIGE